mmetsp:Transcript_66972/g.151347  ORF Transcript_66972/g.151347 Transcript_66972/m.151347 type:complete len:108 (+) Transcript_66972:584-907(+)
MTAQANSQAAAQGSLRIGSVASKEGALASKRSEPLVSGLAASLLKSSAAKKWEPHPGLQVVRRARESKAEEKKAQKLKLRQQAFVQGLRERTLSRKETAFHDLTNMG